MAILEICQNGKNGCEVQVEVNVRTFLNGCNLGYYMFILGGLGVVPQDLMALDLPDDGQTVDIAVPALELRAPKLHRLLPVLLADILGFLLPLFPVLFHGTTSFRRFIYFTRSPGFYTFGLPSGFSSSSRYPRSPSRT